MMRRSLFGFGFGSLALTLSMGCTQNVGTGDVSPPATATDHANDEPTAPLAIAEPSKAKGIVISTLVTHDSRVSILSRVDGDLRVVVRTNDGALVADGITFDELRTADPLLHAIVTSAVATKGTYLDSSLGPVHPTVHAGF